MTSACVTGAETALGDTCVTETRLAGGGELGAKGDEITDDAGFAVVLEAVTLLAAWPAMVLAAVTSCAAPI